VNVGIAHVATATGEENEVGTKTVETVTETEETTKLLGTEVTADLGAKLGTHELAIITTDGDDGTVTTLEDVQCVHESGKTEVPTKTGLEMADGTYTTVVGLETGVTNVHTLLNQVETETETTAELGTDYTNELGTLDGTHED